MRRVSRSRSEQRSARSSPCRSPAYAAVAHSAACPPTTRRSGRAPGWTVGMRSCRSRLAGFSNSSLARVDGDDAALDRTPVDAAQRVQDVADRARRLALTLQLRHERRDVLALALRQLH